MITGRFCECTGIVEEGKARPQERPLVETNSLSTCAQESFEHPFLDLILVHH